MTKKESPERHERHATTGVRGRRASDTDRARKFFFSQGGDDADPIGVEHRFAPATLADGDRDRARVHETQQGALVVGVTLVPHGRHVGIAERIEDAQLGRDVGVEGHEITTTFGDAFPLGERGVERDRPLVTCTADLRIVAFDRGECVGTLAFR